MKNRKWWILASILWMAVIFIFTQMPASTGSSTSNTLENLLVTLHINAVGPSGIDVLNLIIRKSAHVMTFGFLSFLLFKSLEVYRFSYVLAWILTVIYAMSDEYHQSFMPGRTSSIKDVFLFDSIGAFLVQLITFLIIRKKKLKNMKP
ncbi:VanZ family protein [Bacillus sp. USDA818B3_A]|uniref:VanZ family protein n=1 Tax=Bacillus sp. USDA818B3_A TaxID=2698834 RepID=UPI00136867E3|nr:VanZ family protein [Bacillus sp. USDA818B3_A]